MEWHVQACIVNDSIRTRILFVWNKNQGFLVCFVFFSLNGSASYSVISNYNILREAYGGLDSALGIKRDIENSF